MRFLLIAAFLFMSTTAVGETECSPDPSDKHSDATVTRLQKKTLKFVFYNGNPLPPEPGQAEIDGLDARLLTSPADRAFLSCKYQDNKNLWALAIRDTNNDGAPDFRIGEYGGFHENDDDADGDGLINILDVEPYDASLPAGPNPATGIPDHLNWSLDSDKSAAIADIQHEVFDRYNIVLLERSQEFTENFAWAVRDALVHLFGEYLDAREASTGEKGLPALRYIATEKWAGLSRKTDGDTYALVEGQNASLVIYKSGMKLKPSLRIGLLAHEITHNIQFSHDYGKGDFVETMQKHNIYKASEFHDKIKQYGWDFADKPPAQTQQESDDNYQIVLTNFQEVEPVAYTYAGKTPDEWQNKIDDIYYNEADESLTKMLDHPDLKNQHIVGEYSVSSPWEWQGDHTMAYLFIRLEDNAGARGFCDPEGLDELKKTMKRDNIRTWWFYHGNARGNSSGFMDRYEAEFPMSQASLDFLTEKYLLEPLSVCD